MPQAEVVGVQRARHRFALPLRGRAQPRVLARRRVRRVVLRLLRLEALLEALAHASDELGDAARRRAVGLAHKAIAAAVDDRLAVGERRRVHAELLAGEVGASTARVRVVAADGLWHRGRRRRRRPAFGRRRWARRRLAVALDNLWLCTAQDVGRGLLVEEEDDAKVVLRRADVVVDRVTARRTVEAVLHRVEDRWIAVEHEVGAPRCASGQRERLALGGRVRRLAALLVAKLGPEVGAVA